MGDKAQIDFGIRHLPAQAKRVIEVGSKDYGNTASFREHYPAAEYVGLDIEAGPGVDVIQNLEEGTGGIAPADVVICCSVLEHTPKPWKMAKNITKLLKPGGWLYISVPWVQRYHAYPDDYFRFSPSAIRVLFPGIAWGDPWLLTFPDGEHIPFTKGADNIRCIVENGRKYMPYFHINMVGQKAS